MKNLLLAALGSVCLGLVTAEVGNAIVTQGNDPNASEYVASPGLFSGVGQLLTGKVLCTGSLLKGGTHVLTSAHCLLDDNGVFDYSIVGSTTVSFELETGDVVLPISKFFLPQDELKFDGNIYNGGDIAILQLATPASDEIEQYDIYRDFDEVGKEFIKVGFGLIGNGLEGDRYSSLTGKRYGKNTYDSLNDIFQPLDNGYENTIFGSQLIFDFDNGYAENDAFGFYFGSSYVNTGLGIWEVNTALGDSGGPGFIGNLIASITSGGVYEPGYGFITDIDSEINSTFGEFSNETRVSFYQKFIDDVLLGKVKPVNVPEGGVDVPEPAANLGLLVFTTIGAFLFKRSKK